MDNTQVREVNRQFEYAEVSEDEFVEICIAALTDRKQLREMREQLASRTEPEESFDDIISVL